MTGLVVLFALVVLFWGAVALLAKRWPVDAPPSSNAGPWDDITHYQCRCAVGPLGKSERQEASRVEGDLEFDDGRPTDPGEELTVVSEPEWVEDTIVSAGEKLGGRG